MIRKTIQSTEVTPFLVEFMSTFGAPKDPMFWLTLIEEETFELLDAIRDGEPAENQLKEASDLIYTMAGLVCSTPPTFDVLASWEKDRFDVIWNEANEALNFYTKEQEDLSSLWEAIKRVHESNMSKLDENGEPIFREDGKIMKSDLYFEPYLDDLV